MIVGISESTSFVRFEDMGDIRGGEPITVFIAAQPLSDMAAVRREYYQSSRGQFLLKDIKKLPPDILVKMRK